MIRVIRCAMCQARHSLTRATGHLLNRATGHLLNRASRHPLHTLQHAPRVIRVMRCTVRLASSASCAALRATRHTARYREMRIDREGTPWAEVV